MSDKTIVMFALTIGSVVGGYVPVIFGASSFSFISIIGSAVGGLIGIYIALKFTEII